MKITDALVRSGAAKSKGEATRLIAGGGVYLNNIRVERRRCPASRRESCIRNHAGAACRKKELLPRQGLLSLPPLGEKRLEQLRALRAQNALLDLHTMIQQL